MSLKPTKKSRRKKGKRKRTEPSTPTRTIARCPECHARLKRDATSCQYCGSEFESDRIIMKDGDTASVTMEMGASHFKATEEMMKAEQLMYGEIHTLDIADEVFAKPFTDSRRSLRIGPYLWIIVVISILAAMMFLILGAGDARVFWAIIMVEIIIGIFIAAVELGEW
jgi:hypothetical protein